MRSLPYLGLLITVRSVICASLTIPPNGSFSKRNEVPNLSSIDNIPLRPDQAGPPGLHDLLIKTMHNTANYFGFGTNCRNGGHKTEDNQCICPKFYKGKECETKICINGGKLEKIKIPNVHYVCTCPNPKYIEGAHCEKPRCTNGGIFQTFKNGSWACDCSQLYIYSGQFCENIVNVSAPVMTAAFVVCLIILGCICSLNCCQRRFGDRRYEERRCVDERRRIRNEQRSAVRQPQEDTLLSSERGAMRRTAAYPEGVVQPYVVRLDTIPTFNPTMIGGVEPSSDSENRPSHPVGPPPSYDQALSAPATINPPQYTPTDVAKRT